MSTSVYGSALPETVSDRRSFALAKLSLIAAVVAIDFLLWPGDMGIALVLVLAVLFGLKFARMFSETSKSVKMFALGVFVMGVVPMVEVINPLTVMIGLSFTYAASFALSNTVKIDWAERLDMLLSSAVQAPFRFPQFFKALPSFSFGKAEKRVAFGWLGPVALCSVFVVLFAYASPVWQGWLEAIELGKIFDVLFSPRIVFWFCAAWFAWPFIESHVGKLRIFKLARQGLQFTFPNHNLPVHEARWAPFVQRCLILFNLVFATQNILDFGILWGGAALPEGMSYAQYAHRGAYPLVVAALLAGVFVLLTMRPGGLGEQFVLIRNLVLLWIGQNILLLASSLLRLDIYIHNYALTYWRIAAFIWMLLVAAGLVLIVLRFVMKRSTGWLIVANVGVLVTALYVTSFVNLPYTIAKYNFAHSSLAQQGGSRLDLYYLRKMGPYTLPAFAGIEKELKLATDDQLSALKKVQATLFAHHRRYHTTAWRAWTYRDHRLTKFIEEYKEPEQAKVATEDQAEAVVDRKAP